MAQSKVIDFYSTTKRRPDQQSSKRRKIQDASSLFSTIEQKTEAEVVTPSQPSIRKSRTSTRKSTRNRSSKTQPKPTSQKPITDFLPQSSDASKLSPIGDKEDFTFQKISPVTLEHTYVPTDYTINSISPSTTPKKRSHELKFTTTSKRKRRTEGCDTPSSDDISKSLDRELTKSVRKKLILPGTETASENVTRTSMDNNKELTTKLDNKSNQELIPCKQSNENSMDKPINNPMINKAKDQSTSKTDSKTKKTTVTDMKEKLKKCGKLADLKNALKKVDEITKTIKCRKITKTEQPTEVDTKPAPVEQKTSEPPRSSSKPAYQRYKDLAVDIPPSLTLPLKYRLLESMFKGTDTIISILHNRLERCTFGKLKQGVQDMIRRTFEPQHLGQIKTVYPDSYKITHERGVIEPGGMRSNSKYTMCIEAKLDVDENSKNISLRKDGRPVFSSNQVMMRKQTFKHRLYDICKQHHQAFLERLNPPIKVDADELSRWHPKFLVDNVPDIESAALPKPPGSETKHAQTAQQVLEKGRGKMPSRIEKALKKVVEAKETLEKLNKKNEIENTSVGDTVRKENNKTTNNKTAGISSSLLERIRAKEALKAQAAMLRDEEVETELEMLARLPDMIKIIRSCYVTEKKPALLEDIVIVKVCDSYRANISQGTVEKHLTYIQKIFPKWMQKVDLSSGTFLKLNRETELSALNTEISKLVKQKQYI